MPKLHTGKTETKGIRKSGRVLSRKLQRSDLVTLSFRWQQNIQEDVMGEGTDSELNKAEHVMNWETHATGIDRRMIEDMGKNTNGKRMEEKMKGPKKW